MEKLFHTYKNLIEERLSKKPLLLLGEDSIRYDFFSALVERYSLRPSQIHIEVPINSQTFVPANNKESRRKEKPLIDLVVNVDEIKISAEFGLFRQNSNEDAPIDKTARTVKMLNDMIRVGLEAYHTNSKGLFICVADYKMLGHKMRSNIVNRFPSNYLITKQVIDHQLKQKTNKFDNRFLQVFHSLDKNIFSKLIVNERLQSEHVAKETRLLIWEVELVNETLAKKI